MPHLELDDVAADAAADLVVLLTGGTSGVGREAALDLASRGARVEIVGRDREAGADVVETADASPGTVEFHRVDLAEQTAVCDLAARIAGRHDRIDVLAHNAGLHSASRVETTDGIELTLAVNHLAPYLLTRELLDRVRASDHARIVVTASGIHRRGTLDFENLQFERGYGGLDAYSRSKLANVAFTIELAERLEGDPVTANCFHPGFIPGTRLFREARPWTRYGLRAAALLPGVGTTARTGGRRLVRLALSGEFADRSGAYLSGSGVEEPSRAARDPANRRRLWEISAELVDVDPDWV